jgi:hypothetical protein
MSRFPFALFTALTLLGCDQRSVSPPEEIGFAGALGRVLAEDKCAITEGVAGAENVNLFSITFEIYAVGTDELQPPRDRARVPSLGDVVTLVDAQRRDSSLWTEISAREDVLGIGADLSLSTWKHVGELSDDEIARFEGCALSEGSIVQSLPWRELRFVLFETATEICEHRLETDENGEQTETAPGRPCNDKQAYEGHLARL